MKKCVSRILSLALALLTAVGSLSLLSCEKETKETKPVAYTVEADEVSYVTLAYALKQSEKTTATKRTYIQYVCNVYNGLTFSPNVSVLPSSNPLEVTLYNEAGEILGTLLIFSEQTVGIAEPSSSVYCHLSSYALGEEHLGHFEWLYRYGALSDEEIAKLEEEAAKRKAEKNAPTESAE